MSVPQHAPYFHKNQSWKIPVRAATTTAGTLATDYEDGAVVDGVTLATGDRFLLKDAAAPEENGIRIVAASGAPARALDFNSQGEIVGAVVVVIEGTANAMTAWLCATPPAITVDTTALDFAQLGSPGGGGGGGGGGLQLLGPYAIPEAGAAPGFNDTGLTLTVGTIILQAFLIETSPYTNPTDTGDHVIISISSVDGIDVRVQPITRYDMFEQGTITPFPNALLAASDLVGAYIPPAIVFQRPAVVLIEGGPQVDINVADPTGVTYDLYLLAVVA